MQTLKAKVCESIPDVALSTSAGADSSAGGESTAATESGPQGSQTEGNSSSADVVVDAESEISAVDLDVRKTLG